MPRPWGRILIAVSIAGAAGAAVAGAAHVVLPQEGRLPLGLRVAGTPVIPDQSAEAVVQDRSERALSRTITFRYGADQGKPTIAFSATLTELGATIDAEPIARRILAVAREGDLWGRIDEAIEARDGRVDVPVPVSLPIEGIAARLERLKEEHDVHAVPSRRIWEEDEKAGSTGAAGASDVEKRKATPHALGHYLDAYAAAEALDREIRKHPVGDLTLDLPMFSMPPDASQAIVEAVDVTEVVSRFETRFATWGAQAGRAGNIKRAASQVNGVVLMPGEIVSFNEHVGPRSEENGFFHAPEIFKGEMRDGIGGGTCQVAGTLHAAAFFGGLDVVERSPHSRPSGYIRMGLDATVVYPTVDLKLKNPYPFPVVIHAIIDNGKLVFELRGAKKPATVEMQTDTIAMAKFKRKIEDAPWLAPGSFVQKQKGITGHTLRKTRTILLASGERKVEVTIDVYPPTFEIFQVGPGTDPSTLPPDPNDPNAAPAQGTPGTNVASAAPTPSAG